MAQILRGDIFWADLNPVVGHEQPGLRPVLVLSHDVFNERSGNSHCDGNNEPISTCRISSYLRAYEC